MGKKERGYECKGAKQKQVVEKGRGLLFSGLWFGRWGVLGNLGWGGGVSAKGRQEVLVCARLYTCVNTNKSDLVSSDSEIFSCGLWHNVTMK